MHKEYNDFYEETEPILISLTKSISLLTNIGLIAVITVFILNSFLLFNEKSKNDIKSTEKK